MRSPLSARKYRWLWLCLLFLVALAARLIRAQQLHAVYADTIRFIEQAQHLAVAPVTAIREEVYHPLHSVAILITHYVLGVLSPQDPAAVLANRMQWIHAAQVAGIFCSSIISLLIYRLARYLGDRFWPALFAGLMWALSARTSTYGTDGMSDSLSLCLYIASLLWAIRAMRFRIRGASLRYFGFAGLFAGFAYLARPEALAAPLFVTLALLTWSLTRFFLKPSHASRTYKFKLIPRRPLPAKTLAASLAVLWLAAAVPAAPYALAIHGLTHKKPIPLLSTAPENPVPTVELRKSPVLWVWNEVTKTLGYAPTAILLLGFLWHPRGCGRSARFRLLLAIALPLWVVVMFWLLLNFGYLDGRHTLQLQVFLFALLGIALTNWQRPIRALLPTPSQVPQLFAGAVAAVMIIVTLFGLAQVPHRERAIFPQAAAWAKSHLVPAIRICDQQQIVGYYSGHPYVPYWGTPENPAMDSVQFIKNDYVLGSPPPPLVLGYYFKKDVPTALQLGDYRAIAAFPSSTDSTAELYVFYALPGEKVLAGEGERVPAPLDRLPR